MEFENIFKQLLNKRYALLMFTKKSLQFNRADLLKDENHVTNSLIIKFIMTEI